MTDQDNAVQAALEALRAARGDAPPTDIRAATANVVALALASDDDPANDRRLLALALAQFFGLRRQLRVLSQGTRPLLEAIVAEGESDRITPETTAAMLRAAASLTACMDAVGAHAD